MRALAAELREKIDGICIEYHYFKNENVIEKAKEIIPTIQKFCTGFLQGNSYGISEEEYQKVLRKEEAIAREIERVEHATIGTTKEVQELLEQYNSTPLKSGSTLAELIRRPELSYEAIAPLDKERPELPWDVKEQVDINIKYDGYIRRQLKQVEQFKKLEEYRPISIGQASRISGVSPADISVLLVYLSSNR